MRILLLLYCFFVCRSVSLHFVVVGFFFYIVPNHLVTKTTWIGLFGMYSGV